MVSVTVHNLERMSLRTKLIISFVFVIIITISLLSFMNYYRWRSDYFTRVREEGSILTQTLAQGSVDPILRNDFYTLEVYVNNLLKKENIAYVMISDRHDHILAQSPSAKDVPAEIIQRGLQNTTPVFIQTYRNETLKSDVNDISVPVNIDSRKWGTVRVGFTLKHIEKEAYRNISIALATGTASITVGILVALVLMRLITKPLGAVIRSMKTISGGNLHQEISLDTSHEFRVMADSFNQMAKSLRESKEELKRTYEELAQKHKLAALGELAARVAHEIKNPLGIIKGSAQIMLDRESPPEVKEEVGGYIVEEIERLNRKVMNILDYARPRMTNMAPTDINATIEKTLHFWEGQEIRCRGISITKKFDENLPMIKADSEMVRQAFLNLTINACQAMGAHGELVISTQRNGDGYVKVSFRDSGEGIREENLDKIFEPFFTTKEGGTGLGLSIVRQMVESHRGRINVKSRIGEGTEMEILLPIQ